MSIFRHFAPVRAARDLRQFLGDRRPHELGFLALSVVITTLIIAGFIRDSHVEREYRREIIYVESWPLTRSDEEIKAKQVADKIVRDKAMREFRERQEKRKAEFKRLDDRLERWGL